MALPPPESPGAPAPSSPASASASASAAVPGPADNGDLVHDLRNLLNAVNINLHLILRRADELEDVKRWTTKSIESLTAANQLITERLARARVAVAAPIAGLAVDARLEAMRPLLARALPGAAVEYALNAGDARAACDGDSLEAAVFNLAVNARDAMHGAGRIELRTRAVEMAGVPDLAPGAYIELQVRDHGPGLPAAVLADPFAPAPDEEDEHADLRTTLAQVQAFARAAGGIARVTQSDAQGTEMTLWLKAP